MGVKPSIIPPSCFFSLLMTLEATIGEKFVFIVTLKVKPFYSQNRKNRGTTGSLAVYISKFRRLLSVIVIITCGKLDSRWG